MIEHIKIKELISADYDGETTVEEKKIIYEHLKECPDCRKYAQSFPKLSAALRAWTNEDLSADLEQKITRGLPGASKEGSSMKSKNKFVTINTSLIAVVVLVVSLQVYEKRSIQGRMKGAADDIGNQFSKVRDAGSYLKSETEPTTTTQYTPYYLRSDYRIARKESAEKVSGVRSEKQDKQSFMRQQTPPASVSALSIQQAYQGVSEGKEIDFQYRDQRAGGFNTEQYNRIYENEFLRVTENPLSTFSIDVDTASYSNVRRFLNSNQLPPPDAVRIEELINYFNYDYPKPTGEHPFSITTKAAVCPWEPKHDLILVGLQGKTLEARNIPLSNLVFLIDVSGSMDSADKLPLLKSSFRLLVNQLRDDERVAIVVYAGSAGLVLESTPGSQKQKILEAIEQLQAGGSTAGGAGIQLAYRIAQENFIKGGNNRVILATDGDFNVGVSNEGELVRLIEDKRKEGVALTILGFGTGNYKDSQMEQLADKGNGNYYYIDTLKEAQKVLVNELGSTLFTIAKDVKIQIEFNPAQVKAYRLIGYENRILAKEDFNDDTKDAGELGAGHTVTAMYEIIPAGSKEELLSVDQLTYQRTEVVSLSRDVMTVKLRYKEPDGHTSKLIRQTVKAEEVSEKPTGDFQFASAVVEFGLLLRDSKFKGNASYEHAQKSAMASAGKDADNYREEFIDLIGKAGTLDTRTSSEGFGINFKGE